MDDVVMLRGVLEKSFEVSRAQIPQVERPVAEPLVPQTAVQVDPELAFLALGVEVDCGGGAGILAQQGRGPPHARVAVFRRGGVCGGGARVAAA